MTKAIEVLVSAFSRNLSAKAVEQDESREAQDPIRQRMEFHGNLVERLGEEISPVRRQEIEAQMERLRKIAMYRALPRSRW